MTARAPSTYRGARRNLLRGVKVGGKTVPLRTLWARLRTIRDKNGSIWRAP